MVKLLASSDLAGVAQWIERPPSERQVGGSIPFTGTSKSNLLARLTKRQPKSDLAIDYVFIYCDV